MAPRPQKPMEGLEVIVLEEGMVEESKKRGGVGSFGMDSQEGGLLDEW